MANWLKRLLNRSDPADVTGGPSINAQSPASGDQDIPVAGSTSPPPVNQPLSSVPVPPKRRRFLANLRPAVTHGNSARLNNIAGTLQEQLSTPNNAVSPPNNQVAFKQNIIFSAQNQNNPFIERSRAATSDGLAEKVNRVSDNLPLVTTGHPPTSPDIISGQSQREALAAHLNRVPNSTIPGRETVLAVPTLEQKVNGHTESITAKPSAETNSPTPETLPDSASSAVVFSAGNQARQQATAHAETITTRQLEASPRMTRQGATSQTEIPALQQTAAPPKNAARHQPGASPAISTDDYQNLTRKRPEADQTTRQNQSATPEIEQQNAVPDMPPSPPETAQLSRSERLRETSIDRQSERPFASSQTNFTQNTENLPVNHSYIAQVKSEPVSPSSPPPTPSPRMTVAVPQASSAPETPPAVTAAAPPKPDRRDELGVTHSADDIKDQIHRENADFEAQRETQANEQLEALQRERAAAYQAEKQAAREAVQRAQLERVAEREREYQAARAVQEKAADATETGAAESFAADQTPPVAENQHRQFDLQFFGGQSPEPEVPDAGARVEIALESPTSEIGQTSQEAMPASTSLLPEESATVSDFAVQTAPDTLLTAESNYPKESDAAAAPDFNARENFSSATRSFVPPRPASSPTREATATQEIADEKKLTRSQRLRQQINQENEQFYAAREAQWQREAINREIEQHTANFNLAAQQNMATPLSDQAVIFAGEHKSELEIPDALAFADDELPGGEDAQFVGSSASSPGVAVKGTPAAAASRERFDIDHTPGGIRERVAAENLALINNETAYLPEQSALTADGSRLLSTSELAALGLSDADGDTADFDPQTFFVTDGQYPVQQRSSAAELAALQASLVASPMMTGGQLGVPNFPIFATQETPPPAFNGQNFTFNLQFFGGEPASLALPTGSGFADFGAGVTPSFEASDVQYAANPDIAVPWPAAPADLHSPAISKPEIKTGFGAANPADFAAKAALAAGAAGGADNAGNTTDSNGGATAGPNAASAGSQSHFTPGIAQKFASQHPELIQPRSYNNNFQPSNKTDQSSSRGRQQPSGPTRTRQLANHVLQKGKDKLKDYAKRGAEKAIKKGIDLAKKGAQLALKAAKWIAQFLIHLLSNPIVWLALIVILAIVFFVWLFGWLWDDSEEVIQAGYAAPGSENLNSGDDCLKVTKKAMPTKIDDPTTQKQITYVFAIAAASDMKIYFDGGCSDKLSITCKDKDKCPSLTQPDFTTQVCEKLKQEAGSDGFMSFNFEAAYDIPNGNNYRLVNDWEFKAHCEGKDKEGKDKKTDSKTYQAQASTCVGQCGGDGMCWPIVNNSSCYASDWPHGKGSSATYKKIDLGCKNVEVRAPMTGSYTFSYSESVCAASTGCNCLKGSCTTNYNGRFSCNSLMDAQQHGLCSGGNCTLNGKSINPRSLICGGGCQVTFQSPVTKRTYRLLHLDRSVCQKWGTGKSVHFDQGDSIGRTDATGANTAAHTHFETTSYGNVLEEFFPDSASPRYGYTEGDKSKHISNSSPGGPQSRNSNCSW